MRVVIATGIYPPDIGGPATFVPMIAGRWIEEGHDVEVVTYSDIPETPSTPFSVSRVSRTLPLPFRYLAYFWKTFRAAKGARTVFAQDGVASGLPAWLAARLRGARFVVKVVGDFAWEHAQIQAGYGGGLSAFQDARNLPFRIRAMQSIQKFVVGRAARVIVPSRFLAGLVGSWGVSIDRIDVVPNGVDFSDVYPSEDPSAPSSARDASRVLAVGRLSPVKRFDVLLRAFQRVRERIPDTALTIVGDGPEEDDLKRLASSLGLDDCVEFLGRRPRREVFGLMRSSGVLAMTSEHESFPHLLVEAFVAGVAVVATRTGGIPEIVTDGRNGLLVDPGDEADTAEAIVRMLTDRAFAETCAADGRQTAAGTFTFTRQAEGTSASVFGDGIGVVLLGRDASIIDPKSRGADRMRRYASRVRALHAVLFARADAKVIRIGPNATAELVDIRRPSAPIEALSAVFRGIRGIDASLVMAQDPFEVGLVGLAGARLAGARFAAEEHGGAYLGPYWRVESWKNRLRWPLGWLVARSADGLRGVSAKILDDMRRRFPGKPAVSIPVYTEPMACPPPSKAFDFGYVGRFVPQKNLEGLLRAFADVARDRPDIRLLMRGAGPREDRLRYLAMELKIDKQVAWKPFVEDVAETYASVGTLLLPSWYEGWGRVVVEAMQCGVPVVMTDVGCAGEVLRDGIEGRVVAIGDTRAFAGAMRESIDRERHARWSEAARKRAAELDGPDALADRLAAFWKEVIGL